MKMMYLMGHGFGAYGAVLPVVAVEYNKAMDATEAAVREAIAKLRMAATSKTFFDYFLLGPWRGILPNEIPSNISTYLASTETRARQLTASRAKVLAGDLPLEKWVASEQVLVDGMADLAKYLGQESITLRAGNLTSSALAVANRAVDAAAAKAREVVEEAKGAGEAIKTWGPVVAIGVGLIGVAAAWRALFR